MSHQRETIRKQIVTQLKAGAITDILNEIYSNQVDPGWVENFPYISIYSESESSETYSLGATRQYKRNYLVNIDIVGEGEDVDDDLDTYSDAVEDLLEADRTLNGTAKETLLQNTFFEFKEAGKKKVGLCRLVYNVEYIVNV